MRFLRWLCFWTFVIALVALVASFPIESSYRSRAQLIQRVQVDEASALLFGEPGTPVGSPQRMIIDYPKAFLPGTGEDGAKLVDENYLVKNRIYPLQLRTVEFIAMNARIGLGVLGFLGLLGFWFVSRRLRVDCPAGPG